MLNAQPVTFLQVHLHHEDTATQLHSRLEANYGKHWDEINNMRKVIISQMLKNHSQATLRSYFMEVGIAGLNVSRFWMGLSGVGRRVGELEWDLHLSVSHQPTLQSHGDDKMRGDPIEKASGQLLYQSSLDSSTKTLLETVLSFLQ